MPLGLGLGLGLQKPTLPPVSSWPTIADIPQGALVLDNGGVVKQCKTPAGTTWVTRTSASDNNWRSICEHTSTGRLVSVANSGTGNRVMTSNVQKELIKI